MFPLLAMHYLVNALSISAKSIRKVYLALTGGVAPSYFQDLFIGHKSHAVRGTNQGFESAFLHFVVYVILMRTQKQMFRVYARWCIAFVQHLNAFRNRAFENQPRNTVGEYFISERAGTDCSVLFIDGCTHPDPATAFRDLFDPAKKALFKTHATRHINLLCNRKITLKQGE